MQGFGLIKASIPYLKIWIKEKVKLNTKSMKLISYYCEISFIFSISQVENKYKKLV